MKCQIPEAVTVFILAPSRQILEERLRARGEDREEVIAETAAGRGRERSGNYKQYDYVLINRDLAESDARSLRDRARRDGCGGPGSKTRSARFWKHFEFEEDSQNGR